MALEFRFGVYTEITELAKDCFPEKYMEYARIFICPDVRDFQLIRVLEGYAADYDVCPGAYLVEYERIPKLACGQELAVNVLRRVLEQDDPLCSFSIHEFDTIEAVIDSIDNGFGIINLKKDETIGGNT